MHGRSGKTLLDGGSRTRRVSGRGGLPRSRQSHRAGGAPPDSWQYRSPGVPVQSAPAGRRRGKVPSRIVVRIRPRRRSNPAAPPPRGGALARLRYDVAGSTESFFPGARVDLHGCGFRTPSSNPDPSPRRGASGQPLPRCRSQHRAGRSGIHVRRRHTLDPGLRTRSWSSGFAAGSVLITLTNSGGVKSSRLLAGAPIGSRPSGPCPPLRRPARKCSLAIERLLAS
jgi:hypothetical protein